MWRWLERAKGLGRERDGARLPRVYVQSGHVSDADYPRLYLGAWASGARGGLWAGLVGVAEF